MTNGTSFEALFQQAVIAIDNGNTELLGHLLDVHPDLATKCLHSPGSWLRDQVGDALDSFFRDPYLLWFVSEDAVRNKKLPANIVELANIIIQKAKSLNSENLQEQLNYTLRLVAWSWVARECNVQVPLMKLLIDEGANTNGVSNDALVNGNFAAAEYLVQRGAILSLPTALCLGKWEQADILAISANDEQKQFSLVLASLNGKAAAVSRLLSYGGANINQPSPHLYSHATALHHAVGSGSLDTVKRLVDAGARPDIKDSLYGGTAIDWAAYAGREEIERYLRELPPGDL